MLKLHNACIGDIVTVEDLSSTGLLQERMLALGLTKGARVEVIQKRSLR